MPYVLYITIAIAQAVWATRAVLREEKYMTGRDTKIAMLCMFTVLAPIVTAAVVYDAMKSIVARKVKI